jgi:hypothetical protein
MGTAAATSEDVKTVFEDKVRQLENTIAFFEKKVAVLEQENNYLPEKLRLALFRQFGRWPGFFAPGPGGSGATGRSGAKKGGRIRYGDRALGDGTEQGGRRRSPERAEGPARGYGCEGATGPFVLLQFHVFKIINADIIIS